MANSVNLGNAGPQPSGLPGPANVLTIGTVSVGFANATITGMPPDQVLNLVLPNPSAQTMLVEIIEGQSRDLTWGPAVTLASMSYLWSCSGGPSPQVFNPGTSGNGSAIPDWHYSQFPATILPGQNRATITNPTIDGEINFFGEWYQMQKLGAPYAAMFGFNTAWSGQPFVDLAIGNPYWCSGSQALACAIRAFKGQYTLEFEQLLSWGEAGEYGIPYSGGGPFTWASGTRAQYSVLYTKWRNDRLAELTPLMDQTVTLTTLIQSNIDSAGMIALDQTPTPGSTLSVQALFDHQMGMIDVYTNTPGILLLPPDYLVNQTKAYLIDELHPNGGGIRLRHEAFGAFRAYRKAGGNSTPLLLTGVVHSGFNVDFTWNQPIAIDTVVLQESTQTNQLHGLSFEIANVRQAINVGASGIISPNTFRLVLSSNPGSVTWAARICGWVWDQTTQFPISSPVCNICKANPDGSKLSFGTSSIINVPYLAGLTASAYTIPATPFYWYAQAMYMTGTS